MTRTAVFLSAYAIFWFLAFFCLLPVGIGGKDKETGVPLKPRLGLKALIATAAAALLWGVFVLSVARGWLEL
jgi:predicted secreted protein